MTFIVCLIAYLLVGMAWFKTWWWQAIKNDTREHGSVDDLSPIDQEKYWSFLIATVLLWPVATVAAIQGWYERRGETK